MKCEYKGKYCRKTIDGRIKYANGLRVCSWCHWKINDDNKKGIKNGKL